MRELMVREEGIVAKALVTVLAAMALLLSPGAAWGAVQVNESVPLAGLVFTDRCGDDVLVTDGQLHIVMSSTVNGNQISGFSHFQAEGGRGIGVNTGAEYVVLGLTRETFNESLVNGSANLTFVNVFRIVGTGDTPSFVHNVVVHTTINANGDVTADVEIESLGCQ